MTYFDYEHILEEINAIQKEQEKQNEEHEKMMNSYNPKSISNNMQKSMNNFKIPQVKMPKF